MHTQPFRRFLALLLEVAELTGLERQAAINSMQYKSHGKGRGTPPRNFLTSRSKYMPHQGKREMTRRMGRI